MRNRSGGKKGIDGATVKLILEVAYKVWTWIRENTRADHVYNNGEPYLKRWILMDRVRVHKICADDLRDPHDHPWDWFMGMSLKGGADEELYDVDDMGVAAAEPSGSRRIRMFRPRLYKRDATHRVHGLEKPVWTLLVTGRRTRDWGFHWLDQASHQRVWVPHGEYLDEQRDDGVLE